MVRKAPYGQDFHVPKGSNTVTFTDVVINLKDAMNPRSGEFKTPISGIYSFSISAVGHSFTSHTILYVMRNGKLEFAVNDAIGSNIEHLVNYAYVWTMKLQEGDAVSLHTTNWNGFHVNWENFFWFNGQLLHAQA